MRLTTFIQWLFSSGAAVTRTANLVRESSDSDLSGEIVQRQDAGKGSEDAGSTPAIPTTKRGVHATPISRTVGIQSDPQKYEPILIGWGYALVVIDDAIQECELLVDSATAEKYARFTELLEARRNAR